MDSGPRLVVILVGIALLTILVGLPLLFGSWYTVDAGERVLILRFGAINRVTAEGLHLKWPWIESKVRTDIRVRKAEAESAASSKDLQVVHSKIVVNYSADPGMVDDIYRNLGLLWEDRLIDPAINETFKAVTARYTAEELIQKRHQASDSIETDLRERLKPYGFLVADIAITNFDFSEQFNQAIEAKVTAEQRALTAQRDLERVKREAEQKVEMARAEAESLRLQRVSVTPELVQLRAIEKWNGVMPQITSGALPFLNVNESLARQNQ